MKKNKDKKELRKARKILIKKSGDRGFKCERE